MEEFLKRIVQARRCILDEWDTLLNRVTGRDDENVRQIEYQKAEIALAEAEMHLWLHQQRTTALAYMAVPLNSSCLKCGGLPQGKVVLMCTCAEDAK